MTYIQCHFCKSMVDADIFLLQMCATHLAPDFFLDMVLDRFKIKDWLSLSTDTQHLPTRAYRDQDQKVQIIESCLFFIVSILSTRYGSSCERFFINSLKTVSFFSVFIFACWFYNWKHSKYLNRFYYFILWNFHFCDFVIVSFPDYGCLMKPFGLGEIIFCAFEGIFGWFISTHCTVSPLSMFSIN